MTVRWILSAALATVCSVASATQTGAPRCGLEGFTKSPSEHIVLEREKPFLVRSVDGVIMSQSGGWPEGTFVLFELRPTRGAGKLRRVKTDSRGSFKVTDVPAGEYCFKATVDGWQSIAGVIVVTKAADPAARVRLDLNLGR